MSDQNMSDQELCDRIIDLKRRIKSKADGSLNRGLEDLRSALESQPKVNTIKKVEKLEGQNSFTILTDDKNINCTCPIPQGGAPVTIVSPSATVKAAVATGSGPYTANLELTAAVKVGGVNSITVALVWPVGSTGNKGTDMTKPPANENGVTYFDDAKTRVKGKKSKAANDMSVTGVSAAITGISGGITGTNISIGVLDQVVRIGQLSGNAFSVDCTGSERVFSSRGEAVGAFFKSLIPFWALFRLKANSQQAVSQGA